MKELIILILLAIILSFYSCQKSGRQDSSYTADNDSLIAEITRNISEKKKINDLRKDLFTSRLGKSINKYEGIIKKYSKRYGFDWRLIVAQIAQESGFREKARSRVGARGLMQIMPFTAEEISNELDIIYIMKNPRENITAGIYHLNKQMRYFPDASAEDRTKLALASYNGGAGRVFDAQDITDFYSLAANRWKNVNPNLRKLKSSDWKLHLQVWPDGKPPHGYFYGYKETIDYVESIWANYKLYKKIL